MFAPPTMAMTLSNRHALGVVSTNTPPCSSVDGRILEEHVACDLEHLVAGVDQLEHASVT
jgi:hypothetical protein